MNCRNCNTDVPDGCYCAHCGWLNAEIQFMTEKLDIVKKTDGKATIEISNTSQFADVEAKLKIEVTEGTQGVLFLKDASIGSSVLEKTVKIEKGRSSKVDLFYDHTKSHAVKSDKIRLKLCVNSNDNAPYLPGISSNNLPFYRPWNVEQWRSWSHDIEVNLVDPGKIEAEQQLVVFDSKNPVRVVSLINSGNEKVILKSSNFQCSEGFEVLLESNGTVIESKQKYGLRIKCLNAENEQIIGTLTINHDKGESEQVKLYVRKNMLDSPEELYNNIVGVDFGTSKTTVCYVDVLKAFEAGKGINPSLNMVMLEKDTYESPSCIAYDKTSGACYTGKGAQSFTVDWFAERMKTWLKHEKITLTAGQEKIEESTRKVVTDYLEVIYRKTQQAINNDREDNLYVFTLPVLDNDNGILYQKQEETTLYCAEKAGFGDNIKVISEPEAAAYYIVNSQRKFPERWKGASLNEGDVICLFDFGAGTLDITFGSYHIEEATPSVKAIANIGLYQDETGANYSIGGDRIDLNIIEHLVEKYKEDLTLINPQNEKNSQRLLKADSVNSIFITDPSWITFIQNIRSKKELLSNHWNDSSLQNEVAIDEHGILSITREEFKAIVKNEMDRVIKTMRQTMASKGISQSLKYIFMVGGSSLIPFLKDMLSEAFSGVRKVFDPRDYGGDNAREEAIFAVVRGAALSYITRITNTLGFDLYISYESQNNKIESHKLLFKKGDSLADKKSDTRRGDMTGAKCSIYTKLEDGKMYRMGYFNIPTSGLSHTVLKLSFGFNEERQLVVNVVDNTSGGKSANINTGILV